MHPGLRAGPPVLGTGSSAYLHPSSRSVAHVISSKLQSDSFTLSFWLYLLEDTTGSSLTFYNFYHCFWFISHSVNDSFYQLLHPFQSFRFKLHQSYNIFFIFDCVSKYYYSFAFQEMTAHFSHADQTFSCH